jgi:hypothetical protein
MKRTSIPNRIIIIVIVLGGLLISNVLAASGYHLSWWTVDSGGATFSTGGGYSLGGTIGQADAGTLSGGGYILAGGFWETVQQLGGKMFLPVVQRPVLVVIPPQCPDEPNNDQIDAKRLTTINAACSGTLSEADAEDWYWVDLPPGAEIIINLRDLSGGANNELYLLHFKPTFANDGVSNNPGNAPETIEYRRSPSDQTPCNPANPPESGCRFIRITRGSPSPSSNTYTLQVDIQN